MRPFHHRFPAAGGLLLFALLCAAALAGPKYLRGNAATLIVTNTNDGGSGSLRQALADAHDNDIIGFDSALNGQAISLTSGELVINKHVTINGPGPGLLTVKRASGAFRIFNITPAHTVSISGLTIRDGGGEGGGILNDHSTVTLNNCVVRENSAGFDSGDSSGGGIYNNGSGASAAMTIIDSFVNNNRALRTGGGITNNGNGGIVTLSLIGSTVDNNSASDQSAPVGYGDGGGIYNSGQVNIMLSNSSVSNNSAGAIGQVGVPGGYGGGIYGGTLTITNSTINGNSSYFGGGGIYGGQLTMTNSTVSGNGNSTFKGSSGPGGGIWSSGGTITNCVISGNSGGSGGGLYGAAITLINSTISNNVAIQSGGGMSANFQIINCTISQNRASQGGGIYGGGNIAHSTISDNSASEGGGIYASEMLDIRNTILKTGALGANLFNNGGTVTSHGYNICSDNGAGILTGPGDQINTDPLLGPLQNNGGPTFTHDLLPGSPAINAGDPNFTPPPSTDQRGYPRVYNGRIDIGSLEVQPAPTPTPTPTPGPATHFAVVAPGAVVQYFSFDVTVTAQDQFNNTVTNYAGIVHFTSTSTGNGTHLPADSTLTNGTGTFLTRLGSTGEQTITATDIGNPFITGTSNPIFVVPEGNSPTPSPTATATATATSTPTTTPCAGTILFSENFDSLPVGTPGPCWYITNVDPDSPPNCAYTPDNDGIVCCVYDFMGIQIPTATSVLRFRNNFNTEFSGGTYCDGGVLEVSSPNISGGDFLDITDSHVGASFVTGGYTVEMGPNCGTPLAGRMAWAGNSNGYIDTVINLGPNLAGQTIALRFRFCSDEAVAAPGWRIDTIVATDGVCPTPTPSPTATATATSTPSPSPARPLNLSTRMLVQTGDGVGIGGFIVTGSVPKEVLLRGLGPSLAGSGVPDPLADPVMELHGPSGFTTIINDNWRDGNCGFGICTICPTNDLESMICATLDPGAYTAILRGNNNGTGVALVEVYDLDQAAASQLANISTRAFVGTGADVVIGGFILGGGDNAHILIRGLGPSLAGSGVMGVLADPTLELRDGNGALLASNDNCEGSSLPPPDPLEACIEITLPSGPFPAILAGKNGGTGIGLIEIYNVQ